MLSECETLFLYITFPRNIIIHLRKNTKQFGRWFRFAIKFYFAEFILMKAPKRFYLHVCSNRSAQNNTLRVWKISTTFKMADIRA